MCRRFFIQGVRSSARYVTIFASGSTGNCALISQGETNILVDAGLSARRIGACLAHWNLSPQAITAGVITHSHSDHISGLPVPTRRADFPLYATAPTCRQLCYRMAIDDRVHSFAAGEGVCWERSASTTVSAPHPAARAHSPAPSAWARCPCSPAMRTLRG